MKFEAAPTDGIDLYTDIADEFMLKVFGLTVEDGYWISDESCLSDFRDFSDANSMANIKARVLELYGIEDPPNRLLDLFAVIDEDK